MHLISKFPSHHSTPETCLMMPSKMQVCVFIPQPGGRSICSVIGNEWVSARLLACSRPALPSLAQPSCLGHWGRNPLRPLRKSRPGTGHKEHGQPRPSPRTEAWGGLWEILASSAESRWPGRLLQCDLHLIRKLGCANVPTHALSRHPRDIRAKQRAWLFLTPRVPCAG